MSLCEVYDNKFDANYLYEIFSIVQAKLKYKANNVANPTTWPYGGTGTHRLFGSRIIVFPSYLPHKGLGPNIEYPDVYRYSIVFGVQ